MATYMLVVEKTNEVKPIRCAAADVRRAAEDEANRTQSRVRVVQGGVKLYTAQPDSDGRRERIRSRLSGAPWLR